MKAITADCILNLGIGPFVRHHLEDGRERGFRAGANVVMPNLSPSDTRKLYDLYDNKASSGAEAAESPGLLIRKAESVGYNIVYSRGNHNNYKK